MRITFVRLPSDLEYKVNGTIQQPKRTLTDNEFILTLESDFVRAIHRVSTEVFLIPITAVLYMRVNEELEFREEVHEVVADVIKELELSKPVYDKHRVISEGLAHHKLINGELPMKKKDGRKGK